MARKRKANNKAKNNQNLAHNNFRSNVAIFFALISLLVSGGQLLIGDSGILSFIKKPEVVLSMGTIYKNPKNTVRLYLIDNIGEVEAKNVKLILQGFSDDDIAAHGLPHGTKISQAGEFTTGKLKIVDHVFEIPVIPAKSQYKFALHVSNKNIEIVSDSKFGGGHFKNHPAFSEGYFDGGKIKLSPVKLSASES